MFPSRNTFMFEYGIKITSDFDQGNLQKCVMLPHNPNKLESIWTFDAFIAPDSHPYIPDNNAGRAGFFFGVTGVPEEINVFDAKL